jgi:plasmid replication initiation protein
MELANLGQGLGRINVDYLKKVTDGLLCKVVNVPDVYGGYTGFQLFKECKVSVDDRTEWYIEIDAHDKALPLMFEFQNRYFSYQLWNALRLKSSNQIRMYEILKQYEKIGTRVLSLEDLRALLGIEKTEYPRFGDFKNRVLDACQQALQESTDIKFTYESYGKRGKGGKILALKFTIEKNEDYIDQLTLSMFIDENSHAPDKEAVVNHEPSPYDERITFLAEACNNEFSNNEVVILVGEMRKSLPWEMFKDDIKCYDYLMDKYREMLMRSEKTKINNRFGYLKSIIGKDFEP